MIVIDTHVLLWWTGQDEQQLSQPAKDAIKSHMDDGDIYVSSATAWEIAILASRRRIGLSQPVPDWLATIGKIKAVKFVPIDNEIAVRSVLLEDFHKDPADRWIVATAQKLGAPLVTADSKIRDYRHVTTIW